jgi:hypothetical protein
MSFVPNGWWGRRSSGSSCRRRHPWSGGTISPPYSLHCPSADPPPPLLLLPLPPPRVGAST